mmetsp:Transcript_37479/g.92732  ORF Transcript_37479/g.92732 Transcript_37479/m.92732 type:complete len:141 (+) Transcript_37479:593-1015(+)
MKAAQPWAAAALNVGVTEADDGSWGMLKKKNSGTIVWQFTPNKPDKSAGKKRREEAKEGGDGEGGDVENNLPGKPLRWQHTASGEGGGGGGEKKRTQQHSRGGRAAQGLAGHNKKWSGGQHRTGRRCWRRRCQTCRGEGE